MRRLMQIGLCAVLIGGTTVLLHGCGSSNNDQGMSVTAIGYNGWEEKGDDPSGRTCDPEMFTTGMSVPISYGTTAESLSTAGQPVYSCINLQNNMTTVFFRVERVFHEFYIEGASIQPPDSSAPLSIVLGPAPVSGDDDDSSDESTTKASHGISDSPQSSLPPGVENANTISVPFIAVPVEVMEWIALNRNSLPEPPFTMGVTHYVTGVTSAGSRLDTNKLTMFVVVTPDVIITPTDVADAADDASESEKAETSDW